MTDWREKAKVIVESTTQGPWLETFKADVLSCLREALHGVNDAYNDSACLREKLAEVENSLVLARAESAGIGSVLLDVQRDCVAERALADRLAKCLKAACSPDICEHATDALAAYDEARKVKP